MKKLLFPLSILFYALTIAGAIYVLTTGGQASPGFACIPMLLSLFCMAMSRKQNASEPEKAQRNIPTWGVILLVAIGVITAVCTTGFVVVRHRSISVIGGADGPTAIFAAGKVGNPWPLYIALGGIVLIAIVLIIKLRKR